MVLMPIDPDDVQLARSLVTVLGDVAWEVVAFAHGVLALGSGKSVDEAARVMVEKGYSTLRASRDLLGRVEAERFVDLLPKRERTGSAENPITKLFPATLTEQRFIEKLDELTERRPSVTFKDDRESGHTLTDFTASEGDTALPVNIKNAGTRFERAQQLVGLDPDDCIPIPAYKAYAAVEKAPTLLCIVAPDYGLIARLNKLLPNLFDPDESRVWQTLNLLSGARLKKAEDAFVNKIVRKHWARLRELSTASFHAVSARKAIRVLQTKPQRTPGIGLKAWGTGASAEVNVHLSIREEMTPWEAVAERVVREGLIDIARAVNRTRQELVNDPEI